MTYNRETAAFVIAVYIKDLHKWNDGQTIADNLDAAWKLADDLDVRDCVESELEQLGYHVEDAQVALGVIQATDVLMGGAPFTPEDQTQYDEAIAFLLDGA